MEIKDDKVSRGETAFFMLSSVVLVYFFKFLLSYPVNKKGERSRDLALVERGCLISRL